MKKVTKEQFLKRAREVHGWKYDYSQMVFINMKTKIKIICPIHGEFWQTPHNHLQGKGCCKCGHLKTNQSKILSTKEFIERAKKKHPNYLYDETQYFGFNKELIVKCPIHGKFKVVAHNHLIGTGCPKCGILNKGPKRSTTEIFIEKANKIHSNKYDYSKTKYVLANKNVEIICPVHGVFLSTPNKRLSGRGCPMCKRPLGEIFVEQILTSNNYKYLPQYKIKVKSKIRLNLFVDFAVFINNKIYLIEYNGIQHYQPVKYFGGDEKYKEQIERDKLLRDFVENHENYSLLEISYKWNKRTIKSKILNFLNMLQ